MGMEVNRLLRALRTGTDARWSSVRVSERIRLLALLIAVVELIHEHRRAVVIAPILGVLGSARISADIPSRRSGRNPSQIDAVLLLFG